jgi:hypothetical protein
MSHSTRQPVNGMIRPTELDIAVILFTTVPGICEVQLLPPGFKDVDKNKNIDSTNAEELRKILRLHAASFAYFANCSITEVNLIEHHRLSSNNLKEWETASKRNFAFKGDTLILTVYELTGCLKTRPRCI